MTMILLEGDMMILCVRRVEEKKEDAIKGNKK
jgi:hypothetical protein